MPKYFKKQSLEDYVSYMHKHKAILHEDMLTHELKSRVFYYLVPLYFMSPVFFFVAVFSLLAYFFKEYYKEFLQDKRKVQQYSNLFSPKTSNEALALVGYQVFEDELDEHLQLAKSNDDESTKKLGKKQKKMERWENRWRWVGLDKKTLTTHIHLVGKTGAGKTELVRSIANNACFRSGGQLLFVDGKSDTGMLREFVHQAGLEGRETSVKVINFLKGQAAAESNTFSPLSIMHPIKTVEFLGGLVNDGGGGDGNAQYFFEQGKAMLFGVVTSTYARNKYFNEGYNLEKIFDNTKIQNMVFLRILMYSMCRDISDMIKENIVMNAAVRTVKMAPLDEKLKHIELYIQYVTENATMSSMSKEELGIDYVEIREIFVNCFALLDGYLSKMWSQYPRLLDIVSRAVYGMGKNKGLRFWGEGAADSATIKRLFSTLQELTSDEAEDWDSLEENYSLIRTGYIEELEKSKLKTAFHRAMKDGGNIHTPPDNATQQLAYAAQQWSSLASIFAFFKHIFGQTNPEIQPDKLLKDNNFLYVLLPPLDLNPKFVEILGKIIIATIREVASIALLGEKISLHKTISNIHKDKLTPKPFSFVVLDEYGAYAISGLDTILAQCRSLNIAVLVGTQDNASLKVGGTDETSQERALANTTKIIPKTEDTKVIEWVKGMMSDINVETPKIQKDHDGKWVETTDLEIKEQKTFNAEKLRDFGNGFALVFLGSKEEDLIFLQSFYLGGSPETISLKRYINLGLY